jgi:hypothetical protein
MTREHAVDPTPLSRTRVTTFGSWILGFAGSSSPVADRATLVDVVAGVVERQTRWS